MAPGFASRTTVAGVRTRRYQALLSVATTPRTGRVLLVTGFGAWVTTPIGTFALMSHRYAPGVVHPGGVPRIAGFEPDPWPRWTYQLEDGTVVEQEILIPQEANAVVVTWRLAEPTVGITLAVLLLSGREHHALHHEKPAFRFDAAVSKRRGSMTGPTRRAPAACDCAARDALRGHPPREWETP
jgi:hypothetical protein